MDDIAETSSSSIAYNLGYHYVFLSFRGPDTRKIFAGHLYAALQRKKISTFIDSEKLENGSAINLLLEAIDMSRLSIVIFSRDYASSTWSLRELTKIMECMDSNKKQIVVPVFYEVEPAEIRYQTGRFKEASDKHEQDGRKSPEVLQGWRDDTKLIELIAEDIFEKVKVISSSISGWKHDVLVSFRGPNTRKNFVNHLHAAMRRKSISAFVYGEGVELGKSIADELFTAIERSKCSVIVFSENYASSKWCLDELTKIMECRDTTNHNVLPIFYQVEPSDVRHRRGSFGKTFSVHEQQIGIVSMEKMNMWQSALSEAASLSGWDSQQHKDDAKLIEDIVECITKC